jgi:tetratricopeptide (TPR) repeat protein
MLKSKMDQYDEAIKKFLISIKIYRQINGDNHFSVADSYINIGVTYEKIGKYERSIECYNISLKIYLELNG